VRKLWLQLLSGGGVLGVLLHGMGGVGKSTLATLLAHHLESAGAFPGGIFMVPVQNNAQYEADTDTLLGVQHRLLSAVMGRKAYKPTSLEVGAKLLEHELQQLMRIGAGPVVLVIDNVPEGDSGIGELLPADLKDCLADG
jgi:nucleoside-triphosphatase THEP1